MLMQPSYEHALQNSQAQVLEGQPCDQPEDPPSAKGRTTLHPLHCTAYNTSEWSLSEENGTFGSRRLRYLPVVLPRRVSYQKESDAKGPEHSSCDPGV